MAFLQCGIRAADGCVVVGAGATLAVPMGACGTTPCRGKSVRPWHSWKKPIIGAENQRYIDKKGPYKFLRYSAFMMVVTKCLDSLP